MTFPRYVIRRFEFAYNDECYMTDGELGRIEAAFDDEASAQAKLQRLVVQYLRTEDLSNYEAFYEPEEELIERLNAFCIDRCGVPLTDGDGHANELPDGLSDADVFELAQIADLMPYQVVKVPPSGGFVALWLPQEEAYVGTDAYEQSIAYQTHVEALMADVPYELYDAFPSSWQGSFEELSDSPLLLRQLVAAEPRFTYDENTRTLSLANDLWNVPGSVLFGLNALLKHPVFEIHTLSVAHLMDMDA
jgi:hypothetical protein